MGAFLAYLIAAAIGPARNIEYVFLAAVAAWITVLLLPLAASPQTVANWQKWSQLRTPRRLGWLVVASLALLVVSEAGLRLRSLVREQGWLSSSAARVSDSSIVGDDFDGSGLTEYDVGARTARLSAGSFRLAVVTSEPDADRKHPNTYLIRLEQTLPGVKVIPIGVASPAPGNRGELVDRLRGARADLVLALLPACDDLTQDAAPPSWFDWRQFELARLIVGQSIEGAAAAPIAAGDFETFCRALAPQLSACRTPLDASMLERWQRRFEGLDRLAADCRQMELPLALVLVPGEFQVNRALRETLARRAGYKPEQLDVELPQRKLAAFAEDRQLPLIDLLPSLRSCGDSPYERNAATWSDAGHATAATAIGGWLESRYGRQLAVAALTAAP